MSDRLIEVPQNLWDNFLNAVTTANKLKVDTKEAWEAIASELKLVAPTMQVVDAEKRLVTGEPVPTPEMASDRKVVILSSAIRDANEDELKRALQLAKVEPVRSLGEQINKLYDGWTPEAAILEKDSDEQAGIVPSLKLLDGGSDA